LPPKADLDLFTDKKRSGLVTLPKCSGC